MHLCMIAGPPQYRPPLIRASALDSAAGRRTNIQSCGKVSVLNEGIAHFYDSSSGMWEDVWGEHMHIAFYDAGLPLAAALSIDHKQAQLRMIEESLKCRDEQATENHRCRLWHWWQLSVFRPEIWRRGCRDYPEPLSGATFDQAHLCCWAFFQGQLPGCRCIKSTISDEHFDFVWSLECGEHIPDKEKFMSELARITKPGGQILIVTCCHRELSPGEESLKPWEQELLDKVYKAYYFPAWCAPSKYVELAETMGLQDIRLADWAKHVTLFWPAVIASAFTLKGMIGFLKSGWTPIKGALALMSMMKGFNSGLMKYALITARKPSA
ncbi:hypothetical protein L7F22_047961 [Adiantum nelumboides]|nr:hypothetical protein [Adiantum nelumboides]